MDLGCRIGMRGDLAIAIRDAATQQLIRNIAIRNMITYAAGDALIELLAQRTDGPAPGTDQIYSIRMGTSNTTPVRGDTNLGNMVAYKALADINKTLIYGQGVVQFSCTLTSTDANGFSLNEAGLFTKGAGTTVGNEAPSTSLRMFARQIHPTITKTSALQLDYSWRISFAA